MTTTKKNGFLLTDIPKSTDWHHSPIFGYQDISVTTLEKAVEYLASYVERSYVDCVKDYVGQAIEHCKKNTKLTDDESAAIYLYTMATSFHSDLNNALRTENHEEIKPWFAYLKLLITALQKLESQKMIVYRGVASDIQFNFENNPVQTWWTVNSCSTDLKVIEFYLGGMGTVFAIETMHGKDITMYSSKPTEKEVILMPGTRLLRQGGPLEIKDRPFLVAFKECTPIPQGKHLMLSYHNSSQEIVSKIKEALQNEHISVWPDDNSNANHLNKSLVDGVENAAIVCCFITEDYEKSTKCKYELKYAQKRGRIIIPCLLCDAKVCKQSDWLGQIITKDLYLIDAQDVFEPDDIHLIAIEIIRYIDYQSRTSQDQILERANKSCYLFELIRYEYECNSRIERLMNPSKSFPIEQSYINLAIVEAKKQLEKEKQLHDAQHSNAIMGAFEEIYGMKTAIDVKNIFETCKNQEKQVLVFGRAGIGKSTFCRYVAYQWATGSFWPQYELLALIPLRRLTANRYPPLPPGQGYSLIDLVKKEVFQYDLTEKDEILLKKQFDAKKTLWILDGYDEIVQNVPPHLECLLEQLLETPHHIVTSRPYLNILSYDVQMEITGFTDKNIMEYVRQFFDQMNGDLDDVSIKSEKLLTFLKSNSRIWGVAHIPVNLELICSLWSNEDWSEKEQLTITTLYSMMTDWLCRRYLKAQDIPIQNIRKNELYRRCQKELAFLESLAFNATEKNSIIIRPSLLEKALDEAKVSSQDHPHILNIGILKSFNKQGTGTQIETDKDHYFVHLSFQEYFAARYLINALKGFLTEKVIEFIKHQKYNQRYALVFTFAAGLLNEGDPKTCLNIFWDSILGQPLDLVGIRHMQLVISCIEETSDKSILPRRTELLQLIAECIKHNFFMESEIVRNHLSQSLQRAQSVACEQIIINIFINLLQSNNTEKKVTVLSFISQLQISNPSTTLITSIIIASDDKNEQVRENACEALGNIGEKAATKEVISKLVSKLGDESDYVRWTAYQALGKIGEKAATNEVSSKLVSALGDKSKHVRENACAALGKMGEKAATNEVISKLVSDLGDESACVKWSACKALGNIGEKAATNEVISKLVSALGDESSFVRIYACEALGKICEKAVTNEVISKLLSALGDKSGDVRESACEALGKIGEKAATNEAISKLVSALGDKSDDVRWSACRALGEMGEKAATNEVISKLVSTLGDESEYVRESACEVLRNIGEKAATNETISKLVSALGDESEYVRESACEVLRNIGEKAVTNEVISKLVSALGDKIDDVRKSACRALGEIGEKAATNEVISKLVSALGDESDDVRWRACQALGNIVEKAATNEVISKLVSALGDKSDDVRESACEALGKIGGKAVTNEVISKLVSALGDKSKYVRESACAALGNIVEKAATNEVISKLVSALGDESDDVRWRACQALGKIGEKAATNEVISKLVSTLGDKSKHVRESACEALGKIGEKAATNEVISKLVALINSDIVSVSSSAAEAVGDILRTFTVITQLAPSIMSDLCFCKLASECLRNISAEQLVKFFLTTHNPEWLSVVTPLSLLFRVAVTVTEDKVVVYGTTEPFELFIPTPQLRDLLIKVLTDQAKRLHLFSQVSLEA